MLRLVPGPAWITGAAISLILLIVGARYGFLGDEFYFIETGHHLQLAAPDNPMGVPYLAAGWFELVGGRLWLFRAVPALAAGAFVVLGAVAARALGLPRRSQVWASIALASSVITLATGHIFETTTLDLTLTAAALVLVVLALPSDRWGPWLALGIVVGAAMEVKVLIALVMACCLVGIAATGPRRLARPQPWVAMLIAVMLAAPNLYWQAVHGFPMLAIAHNIATGGSTSSTSRVALLPSIFLDAGPVVGVVMIAGIRQLLRRPQRSDHGWLPIGFGLLVLTLLVTGGKSYYAMSFLPLLVAAGVGPVLTWVDARPWRRVVGATLAAVSFAASALVTLPLVPLGSPAFAVVQKVNPDLADEVGWPEFVQTVAAVVATVPAADRGHTVIVTDSYQEAGALQILGKGRDLLPVYSGHNGYGYWPPPPDADTAAIVVGDYSADDLAQAYRHCELGARFETPHRISNGIDGVQVWRCTGQRLPWSQLWPQVRHLA